MTTAERTAHRIRDKRLPVLSALTTALLLPACYEEVDLVDADQSAIALPAALIDTWAARAARIQQRDLQSNVPLDRWQRIGTHNSHVGTTYTQCGDRACYYARANQHRSISAQLEMGIRTLMLDVYDNNSGWGGGDCQWSWDVCFSHSGESFSQWSVAIEDEIARWINSPENKDEVLVLLLEDYFDEGTDNKLQFFDELLYRFDRDYWPGAGTSPQYTSGDLIFRPVDKDIHFPGRWPTPRELVRMGKRILIAVKDRNHYNIDLQPIYGVPGNMRDWFFSAGAHLSANPYSLQYPHWDANFTPSFAPASCGSYQITSSGNVQPLSFSFTQFEERQICDHFETCTGIYQWGEFSQRIDVEAVVECGFSIALDQAEADPGYRGQESYDYYGRTLQKAIWSFGEGEPNNAGNGEHCAEMRGDGRWNDIGCAASLRHACKKTGATCSPASCPADFWALSATAGRWEDGFASCPQGYGFGVPENGYENRNLRELVNGAAVWLSFTDRRAESRWEPGKYQAWYPGEPNNVNNEDCAEMQWDGAWNDVACGAVRPFACRKQGSTCGPAGCPSDFWRLSSAEGPWSSPSCPSGYVFDIPRNPHENERLRAVAAGRTVWLDFTDSYEEGLWESP